MEKYVAKIEKYTVNERIFEKGKIKLFLRECKLFQNTECLSMKLVISI